MKTKIFCMSLVVLLYAQLNAQPLTSFRPDHLKQMQDQQQSGEPRGLLPNVAEIQSRRGKERQIYDFNEQNLLCRVLTQSNNKDGIWENTLLDSTLYDTKGRITYTSSYRFDKEWINYRRNYYTYNGQGNIATKFGQYWSDDSQVWENFDLFTYTYDNKSNKLLCLLEQIYVLDGGGALIDNNKTSYIYDSNGDTLTCLIQMRQGVSFGNKEKIDYINDDRHRVVKKTMWVPSWDDINIWEAIKQQLYTYNEQNLLATDTTKYYRERTDEWRIESLQSYTYNPKGKLLTELRQQWLIGDEIWLNVEKKENKYNENNSLVAFNAYLWDFRLQSWQNKEDLLYTYDEFQNGLSGTHRRWHIDDYDSEEGYWEYEDALLQIPYNNGVSELTFSASQVMVAYLYNDTICSGIDYTMGVEMVGDDLKYQWYYNDKQLVNATQRSYTINNAQPVNSGAYYVMVTSGANTFIARKTALTVNFKASDIISTAQWADVPTINCNTSTNGNYTFSKFQWYKNGNLINNATKPYIQMTNGDNESLYTCTLTIAGGEKVGLCEPIKLIAGQQSKIAVYPNPVSQNSYLTILIPNFKNGTRANIYTMNGEKVRINLVIPAQETTIDLNGLIQGVYVLQIIQADGILENVKFVVK